MTTKKTATKRATKKAAKRKATTKKRVAKRAPAKKRATKKVGRPRTPQAKLDAAVAAFGTGLSVEDAAEEGGVGKRTLERELARLNIQTDDGELIDADMDPQAPSLEVARQGLAHAINALRDMPATHRSFTTQQGVVQKWLGLVRRWEREEAKAETPEQEERRLRREQGAVVERIEQTVSAYEDEAREQGVCLWCGQQVSPQLAAKLHGDQAPAQPSE